MDDIEKIRQLLLSEQNKRLSDLESQALPKHQLRGAIERFLPDAIEQIPKQRLSNALQDPVLNSLLDAAKGKNKDRITQALLPILLPAIKQAIVDQMRAFANAIDGVGQHFFSPQRSRWRKEAKKTGLSFAQIAMQHMLEYRVEWALLLNKKNGALISQIAHIDMVQNHQNFIPLPELLNRINTEMIHVKNDAITDFQKISIDPKTVWLMNGQHTRLVCVITGAAPDALGNEMRTTLDNIEHRLFQKTDVLIDANFQTEVKMHLQPLITLEAMRAVKKPRFSLSKLLGLLFGLAALAFIINALYIKFQQNQFEHALVKRSGVIVTHVHEDGWFKHHFYAKGINDPLTPVEADAVANAMGIPVENIHLDFAPYLSLTPDINLQRAKTALKPPITAQLVLQNGILVASGIASSDWKNRAAIIASGLPYINGFNFDALKIDHAQKLNQAIEKIETTLIYFAKDTVPTVETENALPKLAEAIKQTQELGAETGQVMHVVITGYTDGVGSVEANQALRKQRAEFVKARLINLGVNADVLDTAQANDAQERVQNYSLLRTQMTVRFETKK